MKIAKLFMISASAYFLCACGSSLPKENSSATLDGKFRVEMELNDSTSLPFTLSLTKHNSNTQATVYNSNESIISDEVSISADSVYIMMPVFGSQMAFKILNHNTLQGKFTSPNRPADYEIKLSAKKEEKRFDAHSEEFAGRYKIMFANDSTDLAIGIFNSANGIVNATFATETGDYRFIEGVVENGKLKMSCFDGAHYFYFDADVKGDSLLNGNFYSGNHYHTTWSGVINNEFQLREATNLTSPLEANAVIQKEIAGLQIPQPGAKITAVQILGTWCPNCMDETRYYASTLLPKYKSKGLEVVGLAFEYTGSDSLTEARIQRFKNDLGVNYPIVKAGNASKAEASEMFPQLSKIISFPSTIFLNENGEILRVHTGFYGPGTGRHYDEYVKETEEFLNSHL
jgi:thiol-disulfide isomerase/thioredoxin